MILVIDHYDSFIDMICDYLLQLGHDYRMVKTDKLCGTEPNTLAPEHIILGPGPGHPADQSLATVNQLITNAIARQTPILGICLGHQILAQYFGATIDYGEFPAHGIVSSINHDCCGIFSGIPTPLKVTRYHSLIVKDLNIAQETIRVTATTAKGEIMAISHKQLPIHGIQFHPESIMTESGKELLANFLSNKCENL